MPRNALDILDERMKSNPELLKAYEKELAMKNWYKPEEDLPVQGKKILCMHKGDFYVAQRWGKYWFSIPFADSIYSRYHAPELWQEIDFPNNLTGMILISINDELMDIDELEIKHPEIYRQMLEMQLDLFKNCVEDIEK